MYIYIAMFFLILLVMAETHLVKVAAMLSLSLIIIIVASVTMGLVIRYPQVNPTKVSMYDCIDAYAFNLNDYVRVYVCRNEYVDIRRWGDVGVINGTKYTVEQWGKFCMMIDTIEYDIGIMRLDENNTIFTRDFHSIMLCNMVNGIPTHKGISLNMQEWFHLVQITPKINNVLGLKEQSEII